MKKVITLLLVAVMVFAMATTAFAAKVGDEVKFVFKTNGNPGFASYNAQINYDSTALKLVKIEEGALTKDADGFFAGELSTAKTGYAGVTDVTGDGVLFTAYFEVISPNGDHSVSASIIPGSMSNAAGESVNVGSGFITGGGTVDVSCDHVWGEWTVTKEATCGTDGEKIRTCSVCGKEETEVIPATGKHTWGDWEVTKKPTCTKKGEKVRTCDVCGKTEKKTIKALGHNYVNGVCSRCNAKTDLDDNHGTGDITGVVTMSVVAMISVVAAAAYVTKRRITK